MPLVRIATRASTLAVWQANHVAKLLCATNAQLRICLCPMHSDADLMPEVDLKQLIGKDLFITKLETALQNGNCDIAVHSLKDVGNQLRQPFKLSAYLGGDLDCDVLVLSKKHQRKTSARFLAQPHLIGTSSPRRASLLNSLYPKLKIAPIRGNIETRLNKLDTGQYDGLILAEAALVRLGLQARINHRFDPKVFIPAIGQGVLVIEQLKQAQDIQKITTSLNNRQLAQKVKFARKISALLQANCHTALGLYIQASSKAGLFRLRAHYAPHFELDQLDNLPPPVNLNTETDLSLAAARALASQLKNLAKLHV